MELMRYKRNRPSQDEEFSIRMTTMTTMYLHSNLPPDSLLLLHLSRTTIQMTTINPPTMSLISSPTTNSAPKTCSPTSEKPVSRLSPPKLEPKLTPKKTTQNQSPQNARTPPFDQSVDPQ